MPSIINATTTNGVVIQPDNSGSLVLQSSGTTKATVDSGGFKINGDYAVAYQGMKNRLINGNMDIWQRGTSFTGSGSLTYFADRWSSIQYAGSTSTVTRQSSGITGISYCMRMQRPNGATNTGTINLGQSIESINCLDLAGQNVTISFYARAGSNFSAASSSLISAIYSGTGTDQNIYTGYTGSTDSSTTNTLTTSWQKFSLTRTIPSNATEVGVAFYYTPVGTAGANDYYEIAQVQLEIGSTATLFERRLYGQELALCQRYFEAAYDISGTTWFDQYWFSGNVNNGATYYDAVPFKVTKRTTTPTVTTFRLGESNFNSAAPTVGNATSGGFAVNKAATNTNAGYYVYSYYVSNEL
jgi:hypothetical protein